MKLFAQAAAAQPGLQEFNNLVLQYQEEAYSAASTWRAARGARPG